MGPWWSMMVTFNAKIPPPWRVVKPHTIIKNGILQLDQPPICKNFITQQGIDEKMNVRMRTSGKYIMVLYGGGGGDDERPHGARLTLECGATGLGRFRRQTAATHHARAPVPFGPMPRGLAILHVDRCIA